MSKKRNWTAVGLGIQVVAAVIVAVDPLLAIPVSLLGFAIIAWGLFPTFLQRCASRLPGWRIVRQPNTQPGERRSIERQPINHAYEHLIGVGACEEDGNEALRIASILRQAALDGQILIWGAEPSSVPDEWHNPLLLEIERDYWRHYEIDPVSLMISAGELPEQGCTTLGSSSRHPQNECYRHLHVNMNEIRSRWPSNSAAVK